MARLFEQIVGHGAVLERLLEAAARGRLSPTLLLVGAPGIGKTLVARALAQALVCDRTAQACGACPPCLRIGKGESESLLHVAPDGLQIKMEQAQEVLRFLNLQAWGKARIVLLEDAHLLNVQAANALLKSLEEPPEKTFFILTAINAQSVLATIRSRSQLVRLVPLSATEIKSLGPVEDWMVQSSMGRLDVLSQLRDPQVVERRQAALNLWLEVGLRSPLSLAQASIEQAEDKEQTLQLVQWWRQLLRDACFRQRQLGPLIHSDLVAITDRLTSMPAELLHGLHQELLDLEAGLKGNWDRQLAFENFFLRADAVVRAQ
ncbi:MAG: AAA family ATPase [Bdellovibrionales bacterium]|nr:AAA family ATPase [Bdellovibrionales bacterium]